jgi:hypothetical protein
MRNRLLSAFIFLSLLATASSCANKDARLPPRAYVPVDRQLFDVIARLDADVFAAFNAGDFEGQKKYFDGTLEFYHDTAGFTDYRQFSENSIRLLARKDRPRRTLVPGTLEVYPIKDYGAIQLGIHRFCHNLDGNDDCGTFKFVHIWRRQGPDWKIVRVISYDH